MNICHESQIFTKQQINRLEAAKKVRAAAVYDTCETLVSSLADVERFVETGEYKNKEDRDYGNC